MIRAHPDAGDSRGRDLTPGHGQAHRVGRGTAHDQLTPLVAEGTEPAVGLGELEPIVDLGLTEGLAEGEQDRLQIGAHLVGRRHPDIPGVCGVVRGGTLMPPSCHDRASRIRLDRMAGTSSPPAPHPRSSYSTNQPVIGHPAP